MFVCLWPDGLRQRQYRWKDVYCEAARKLIEKEKMPRCISCLLGAIVLMFVCLWPERLRQRHFRKNDVQGELVQVMTKETDRLAFQLITPWFVRMHVARKVAAEEVSR
eukprot:TRINITY_DN1077_c0_g1_i1.p1 TRINITY_DN1077_c0_g1~~TRINITY_DN1077_c0_g1_i1.p1  ORF type:complete len:108 (+),score=16.91 TRINITY_DN1077_c0_g1_i1:216-539(+)